LKLGYVAGAIVVFCLWLTLATWIFGQLDNFGWVAHLIYSVVCVIAFRLTFAIYDRKVVARKQDVFRLACAIYDRKVVARKQDDGLLLAMNSKATPIGAVITIVVVSLLTVLVIGAEIHFSASYRWKILFAGGGMLLIVANCVESYERKRQKYQ